MLGFAQVLIALDISDRAAINSGNPTTQFSYVRSVVHKKIEVTHTTLGKLTTLLLSLNKIKRSARFKANLPL